MTAIKNPARALTPVKARAGRKRDRRRY